MVLSNSGLFCVLGQVKFVLYFQANVICESSPTNKKKLQFTVDDSNSEAEKVIIIVHKNNYCRDNKIITIQQDTLYRRKSLTDQMSL